ncbi:MAG: hypothetical protein K8953_10100, partial [Proteobacteria bacterium]|nr:hypothetical protein [Pseudomonadota bacterium]
PKGKNVITLNGKDVTIDADWGAVGTQPLGRIRGTITGLDTVAGTLTGLIGSGGAVGAFISGAGSTAHYAGGFVANPDRIIRNSVSYNDWIGSFGDTPPAPTPNITFTGLAEIRNEFLQSTDGTLPTARYFANRDTTPASGTITPELLKLDSVGGDASDGVAFFRGYHNPTIAPHILFTNYYAGILSTTNLGAPLTQTDGTATWNGKFRAIGDGKEATANNFELKVTFGDTPDAAGSVEAFVNQSGNNYYHLEGTYDSNGAIKGTVDFGAFSGDSNIDAQTPMGARAPNDRGTLTGLIGHEGAVGVFISNETRAVGDTGYAGGFVARPAQ